jgi:hypothetical protein
MKSLNGFFKMKLYIIAIVLFPISVCFGDIGEILNCCDCKIVIPYIIKDSVPGNEKAIQEQIDLEISLSYMQRENSAPTAVKLKLARMRSKISDYHLPFEVGYTSVSNLNLAKLTGEQNLTNIERENLMRRFKEYDSKNNRTDKITAVKYTTINGVPLSPNSPRLDLREYGLVTPVVNQDTAGACWAFGSVAAFESNYVIKNHLIIDASEQYVINCSGAGSVHNGGLAFLVFQWMVDAHKNIDSESGTPYTEIDSNCPLTPPKTNYYSIDWRLVDPNSPPDPDIIPTVEQIKDAICKYGVISASVYVSDFFQQYTSGVLLENVNYPGTNHAIAIIGWDDSKNAWIVKNSWGTGWGNTCGYGNSAGYIYINYKSNNVGRRAAWVRVQ